MLLDNKPMTAKDAIKFFSMKKDTLKKLGIKNYVATRKFKDIDEIFQCDTGMVIGQCVKDCEITVNGMPVKMRKGEPYVMPLNHFVNSYKDKSQRAFKPYRKSFTDYFKRYMGQNLDGKKLLISRTGGLGDLVVTQSVIKAIKEKYPTCEITYGTTGAFIDLFRCFPKGLIDKVAAIPYHANLLKENDYHMLFIHAIENCEETKKENYFDIFQKVSKIDYNSRDYISELKSPPYLFEETKRYVPPNTVLLHMESTTKLRANSPHNWVEIKRLLISEGFNVGIIDRKERSEEIDKYIANIGLDQTKLINLSKFSSSISHGISLYEHCIGGIVIDSTFAHISGALRKPSVCICGPYPAYNVVGAYETVAGIEKAPEWNECGKAPCYFNSQHHLCPFLLSNQAPGCITSITPKSVVELFKQQLTKFGN